MRDVHVCRLPLAMLAMHALSEQQGLATPSPIFIENETNK
jgi:hypothetical protein